MNLLPYLILLVPIFLYAGNINNFAFTIGSQYSDVLITHYPNAVFVHNTVEHFSQIPLWSNLINSGYPFYGDPLSGIYYFPTWIINLFPGALTINLMVFLHIYGGAVGIYRFLKKDGLEDYAALAGAIVFGFFPKIWAHFGAGHITLLFGIGWLPWLLLIEKEIQESNKKRQKIYNVLSSIVYAQIILADVRMAAYAGLLWLGYSLSLRLVRLIQEKTNVDVNFWAITKASVNTSLNIFLRFSYSLLLSSPFLIPFFQFVSVSTRKLIVSEDAFTFSLPPLKLIGLFFPDIGSNPEAVIYPGSFVIVISLICLANKEFIKENLFWLLISTLTIVFSLGSYLPFSNLWGGIISPSLLRVPTRILFLFSVSCAVMSGRGIQSILLGKCKIFKKRFSKIFGFIVFALFWCFTFAVLLIKDFTSTIKVEFLWGCLFLTVTAMLFLFMDHQIISQKCIKIAMVPIMLLDVAGISYLGLEFKSDNNYSDVTKIIENHSNNDERFRTFSPSYSVLQQEAAQMSIEMADGINPMQLMSYAEYFGLASGVPYDSYSVTLPTYSTGHPEYDNITSTPSAVYLGRLNVKYMISQFPIIGVEQISLLTSIDGFYIYENMAFLPRVWLEARNRPYEVIGERLVELKKYSPNEITILAEGPGRLHFSEIFYPGWNAYVDSKPKEIELIDGLFRGVDLAEGTHIVTLIFTPMDMYIGIGINLLALVVSLLYIQEIIPLKHH